MKYIIYLSLLLNLYSCKQNSESKRNIESTKIDTKPTKIDTKSTSNYHDNNCFIKSDTFQNAKCKINGQNDWLCGREQLKYKLLTQINNVTLLLVPQDCGNFKDRFFLLTIKNNKIIDNLYVKGKWYEEMDNPSDIETTSYTLKNNSIEVTKTWKGEDFLNSTGTKKYSINNQGKIKELKQLQE